MGLSVSKLFNWLRADRDVRIVMVGLDAAGKTTILYKLKLGEVISTMPTIGFNVETVAYKSLNMTVWDVGGQTKIRPLWKYYYNNTDAVIFVCDSTDKERFEEAKQELHGLLDSDELRNAHLLVYANKQDCPGANDTSTVAERLGLHELKSREWFVQSSSAKTGDGLYEGMDWLSRVVKA
eukprot:m.216692 g.216692  ORF g.216692 m.216692 type:complete len:180 (+) comp13809_c1_seq1:271-810(+)